MEPEKITVVGLGRIEALELQQRLKLKGAITEQTPLATNQQGDLGEVQLILPYVPMLVGVLGLWLLKPARRKTIKRTVKVKDKDGTEREETFYLDEHSSESPSKTVVGALSKLFGLTTSVVAQAIKQAASSPTTEV